MKSAQQKTNEWREYEEKQSKNAIEPNTPLPTLAVGTVVRAKRQVDPDVCNIEPNTLGFVFGETNCYGDLAGPIIQWITASGGLPSGKLTEVRSDAPLLSAQKVCNVYPGDIDVIRTHDTVFVGHVDAHPPDDTLGALKRLLHYSWEPIDYQYIGLTQREKQAISEPNFNALVEWIKEG